MKLVGTKDEPKQAKPVEQLAKIFKILVTSEPQDAPDEEAVSFYHEGNDYVVLEQLRDQLAMLPDVVDIDPPVDMSTADVGEPGETSADEVAELRQILDKHVSAFLGSGNALPPPARGVVCDIEVEPGIVPIADKPRCIKSHLLPQVYELLKKLLEAAIIEYSDSEWASPIVIVMKKDGKTIRLCIDYRRVNQLIRLMNYPLPLIDDLLGNSEAVMWFLSLDMASGFWAIEMTLRAKHISAFVCPLGHFQWVRMPFGLKNAPLIYQKVIDNALWGYVRLPPHLEAEVEPEVLDALGLQPVTDEERAQSKLTNDSKTVFELGIPSPQCLGPVLGRSSYIGDIAYGAKTWNELLEVLDRLMNRLRYWRISVSLPKSAFGKRSIQYLSHEVGREGIVATPKVVKGLRELPFPVSLKAVQSFLGSLNYYNKFIEDFSVVASILYELTDERIRSDDRIEPAKRAFDLLKEKILSPPMLRHPERSKPYVVIPHANQWAIGAVLAQEHDGVLVPVRYVGRTLHDAELNYHLREKEVLASLRVLSVYYTLVAGEKLVVYTRYSSLKWILNSKSVQGRMLQWSALLSPWTIEVHKIEYDEDGLAALVAASITPREKLDLVASELVPLKTMRAKQAVVSVEMLDAEYAGYVLSFDEAAKLKTRVGSASFIVWELPSWTPVYARSIHLEGVTVNEAEYAGLLQGLEFVSTWSQPAPVSTLVVVGDSRIVVQQCQGTIGCNQPHLLLLRNRYEELKQRFQSLDLVHAKREYNGAADYLAGLALRTGETREVTDEETFSQLRQLNDFRTHMIRQAGAEKMRDRSAAPDSRAAGQPSDVIPAPRSSSPSPDPPAVLRDGELARSDAPEPLADDVGDCGRQGEDCNAGERSDDLRVIKDPLESAGERRDSTTAPKEVATRTGTPELANSGTAAVYEKQNDAVSTTGTAPALASNTHQEETECGLGACRATPSATVFAAMTRSRARRVATDARPAAVDETSRGALAPRLSRRQARRAHPEERRDVPAAQVSSRGAAQGSSQGAIQASSRGAVPVSGRGVVQAPSNGVAQEPSRGTVAVQDPSHDAPSSQVEVEDDVRPTDPVSSRTRSRGVQSDAPNLQVEERRRARPEPTTKQGFLPSSGPAIDRVFATARVSAPRQRVDRQAHPEDSAPSQINSRSNLEPPTAVSRARVSHHPQDSTPSQNPVDPSLPSEVSPDNFVSGQGAQLQPRVGDFSVTLPPTGNQPTVIPGRLVAMNDGPLPLRDQATAGSESDGGAVRPAVELRAEDRRDSQAVAERWRRVHAHQDADPHVKELKDFLRGDVSALTREDVVRLAKIADQYVLEADGVLKYVSLRPSAREKPPKLVVPVSLRKDVLHLCHDEYQGGHQGVTRTYQRVRDEYYWVGMFLDVQRYCASCIDCSTGKGTPTNPGPSPGNIMPEYPFHVVSMDFVGPLPLSEYGSTSLLLFQCMFSGYVMCKAMADMSAPAVAKAYDQVVFQRFGASAVLRHDQDPAFMSEVFTHFRSMLGSRQRATLAYRPQANGQQERSVQTVSRSIKAYVMRPGQDDWEDVVYRLMFTLNTSYDATRRETPFFLVHGWDAKSTVAAMLAEPPAKRRGNRYEAYLWRVKMQRDYQYALAWARDLQDRAKKKRAAKQTKDREALPPKAKSGFEKDDAVWLYLARVKPGLSRKLAHHWHGPFRILEKANDHRVQLKTEGTNYRLNPWVHVSRLKPRILYPERPTGELDPVPEDLDWDAALLPEDSWEPNHAAGEYEMEAILDVKWESRRTRAGNKNHRLDKVKFVGYEEPEWIPAQQIKAGRLLYEFDNSRRGESRFEAMQSGDAEGSEDELH